MMLVGVSFLESSSQVIYPYKHVVCRALIRDEIRRWIGKDYSRSLNEDLTSLFLPMERQNIVMRP